jgi:hypothetical protein
MLQDNLWAILNDAYPLEEDVILRLTPNAILAIARVLRGYISGQQGLPWSITQVTS